MIIKGVTEAVSLTYFEVVSLYNSTGLFIFVSIVLRKHCLKGEQLSPRSNEWRTVAVLSKRESDPHLHYKYKASHSSVFVMSQQWKAL